MSNELGRLTNLIEDFENQEKAIIQLEEELKERKAHLEGFVQGELTDAFINAGVTEVKTLDGVKHTMQMKLRTSVKKDKKAEAMSFLVNDENSKHLVKTSVVVEMKDATSAAKLSEELENSGLMCKVDVSIPPATLTKFGNDELKEGRKLPDELFNSFEQTVIKSKGN